MKFQIRLGTLLLLFTLAGFLAGWYGPRVVRWVRGWRATPPVYNAPAFPSTGDEDQLPFYLEPAETPLE